MGCEKLFIHDLLLMFSVVMICADGQVTDASVAMFTV